MLPLDSWAFHSGELRRILLCELRSFRERIRLQIGSRTRFACSTDLPLFSRSTNGRLLLSLETLARTTGIEAMRAKYPGATTYDALLYLEGWNRAAEWIRYTEGNAGRGRVQAYEALTDQEDMLTEGDAIVADAFHALK